MEIGNFYDIASITEADDTTEVWKTTETTTEQVTSTTEIVTTETTFIILAKTLLMNK